MFVIFHRVCGIFFANLVTLINLFLLIDVGPVCIVGFFKIYTMLIWLDVVEVKATRTFVCNYKPVERDGF